MAYYLYDKYLISENQERCDSLTATPYLNLLHSSDAMIFDYLLFPLNLPSKITPYLGNTTKDIKVVTNEENVQKIQDMGYDTISFQDSKTIHHK